MPPPNNAGPSNERHAADANCRGVPSDRREIVATPIWTVVHDWIMVHTPQLTQVRKAVLDAARRIQTRGAPASVRELAEAVGFRSPNAAHLHLLALERLGLMHRVRRLWVALPERSNIE